MKNYKIWVQIEEYDSKLDEYSNDEPIDLACFSNKRAATAFLYKIVAKFGDAACKSLEKSLLKTTK